MFLAETKLGFGALPRRIRVCAGPRGLDRHDIVSMALCHLFSDSRSAPRTQTVVGASWTALSRPIGSKQRPHGASERCGWSYPLGPSIAGDYASPPSSKPSCGVRRRQPWRSD